MAALKWQGGPASLGVTRAALGATPAPETRVYQVAADGVLKAESTFNTLVARWTGDPTAIPGVRVSIQGSDGSWSDWYELHQDHHAPLSPAGYIHYTPLLARGVAFRVEADGTLALGSLEILTYDTSSDGQPGLLGSNGAPGSGMDLIDGFIIPRAGWGADESFRHENQDPSQPIAWPPRYAEIGHVVVHHTETSFGWDDPAAVVRSIYHYHAVVLGWGDIGYNFLVDGYGNVYEGRFGGPNVVGGHAMEYNTGSLGVALIGSYVGTAPSAAALDALVRLIKVRAGHVDPTKATNWIDWAGVPNICGHGDVMSTQCPGADLAAVLPTVRGRLAGTGPITFPKPVRLWNPRLVSFSASPTLVEPGGLIEIRATIRNDGAETLQTQGPDPGFIYDEGQDFDTVGHHKQDGRFRLAVSIAGESGIPNPYRWGFGGPIASGEEREVVGYIRVNDMGTRVLNASLVREFVRYYAEDEWSDAVHVVHPLVSRVEQGAGGHYFPETGHNVPAAFYEYWQNHGGLERFGFPLTEAFDELSETDGNVYLTQYFERARFEYHPELEARNDAVKLGLLGAEVASARRSETPFLPVAPVASTADVWYFPETRHTTSYRFLEYWIRNGGVESFGYPISEKFEEPSQTDGKIHLVQYFERVRLEYHPDDVWEKQIKLGHLGREILIRRGWLPAPGVED